MRRKVRSNGNTAVELRKIIYVAIYLNKLHFVNVWSLECIFQDASGGKTTYILCT